MLSVKVDLSSLKKVEGELRSIKKSLANKGMKKAIGASCRVLNKGLKSNIPVRAGLLKKSTSFKVWKSKKSGQIVGKVGAKNIQGAALFRGNKTGKFKAATTAKQVAKLGSNNKFTRAGNVNPAHYLHLVDGGAKPHQITTPFPHGRRVVVNHPGFKGRRVLEKTVQQCGSNAVSAAAASLDQSLREAASSNG